MPQSVFIDIMSKRPSKKPKTKKQSELKASFTAKNSAFLGCLYGTELVIFGLLFDIFGPMFAYFGQGATWETSVHHTLLSSKSLTQDQ